MEIRWEIRCKPTILFVRSGYWPTAQKPSFSFKDDAGLKHLLVLPENESRSSKWFLTLGWRMRPWQLYSTPLQRVMCNKNSGRTVSWQAGTVQGSALRGRVDSGKGTTLGTGLGCLGLQDTHPVPNLLCTNSIHTSWECGSEGQFLVSFSLSWGVFSLKGLHYEFQNDGILAHSSWEKITQLSWMICSHLSW